MTSDRINYLLEQYLADKASDKETMELRTIMQEKEHAAAVTMAMELFIEKTSSPEWKAERLDEMVQEVLEVDRVVNGEWKARSGEGVVRRMSVWKKIAVAASIVFMLGVSYWILAERKTKELEIVKTTIPKDVKAPETNRAMITLADGRVVYLDSAANGQLAMQGNVNVVKTSDGQIVYNGSSTSLSVTYNTLFNPRGSKVQPLTLNDGTKVWLNSESSIKYPTAFIGNERKVEITGEAYFEVTHDANKKFVVTTNGVNTEVLGTHFNVNAYEDESEIKVTLLEGSVKVESGAGSRESVVIKPGEQAKTTGNGQLAISKEVDVEMVMAWKNGRFQFNKASLQEVMRQLARWYNVEVSYEGNIPAQQFGGKMQRDLNLSEVLEGLKKSEVHFRIEGNKVIVTK